MKEERKKYEKPQSYTIEMKEPLMQTVSIGISTEIENRPGPMGAPRYQGKDAWDQGNDDWDEGEDTWDE